MPPMCRGNVAMWDGIGVGAWGVGGIFGMIFRGANCAKVEGNLFGMRLMMSTISLERGGIESLAVHVNIPS